MLEAGADHIQKSQEGTATTPGAADSITAQDNGGPFDMVLIEANNRLDKA